MEKQEQNHKRFTQGSLERTSSMKQFRRCKQKHRLDRASDMIGSSQTKIRRILTTGAQAAFYGQKVRLK
jgi:hypothetical protein